MTADRERLHLNGGSVIVELQSHSASQSDGIIRDIQLIHDRKVSRPTMWMRRQRMVGSLPLQASKRGIAYALFEARIEALTEAERVSVMLENPERANQAAGWAALQLYGELAEGRPLITEMYAVDPTVRTFERVQRKEDSSAKLLAVRQHDAPGGIQPSEEELANPHIKFLSYVHDRTVNGTYVTFINNRQLSLPNILWQIKERYDEIYPPRYFPTHDHSTHVAGIVGATNLEEFHHAWETAVERRPGKPVEAANILLTSGAFTATQPDA